MRLRCRFTHSTPIGLCGLLVLSLAGIASSGIVANGLVLNLDASDNPQAATNQWADLSSIASSYDGSGFGTQARMHASNGAANPVIDANNVAFYTTLGTAAVFGPFGENDPPFLSEPNITVESWTVEL